MPGNKGERTRDALFESAKGLFEEIGYARTTHAEISYDAGVGRTTFYEYFSSKEDLLVQLVERDLPQLVDDLVGGVDQSRTPDERLYQLTIAIVEFLGTDNIGLILHTEVPRLSLEAQAAIAKSHSGMSAAFMTIYRDGIQSGTFLDMPPRLAGRLIEQTIMTGGRVVMDSEDPKQHAHAVAELTARFLVNALRPT